MPNAVAAITTTVANVLFKIGFTKKFALVASSFLVKTAGTVAVSAGLNALVGRPGAPDFADAGRTLSFSGQSNRPREFIYGEATVVGQPVFVRSAGTNREFLDMIIALGDGGPYESVEEIKIGEDVVTLDGSGNVTAPAKYVGFAQIVLDLGSETTTAIADAVTNINVWTSNHIGKGVCKAYVRLKWDPDVWTSGQPLIFFKLRGRKVYDQRLDSTNGGSGTHRQNDPTTWEWSQNKALWIQDYARGILMNSTRVGGLGLQDSLIDWDGIADAADVCDEAVNVNGGGTIDRYTGGGGLITSADDPVQTLEAMAACIAGDIVPRSGYFSIYAGAAKTATVTLTDDDLAGDISLQTAKSIRETANVIRTQYAEPEDSNQFTYAPDYSDATWVSDDGGEELVREFPLPFEDDHRRAQRIAKILGSKLREPRVLRALWKQKAMQVREGDAFNWTSDRFPSSVEGKYICLNRTIFSDGTVEIEARSEDDAKYDWDETTEEQSRTSPGDIGEPTTGFNSGNYPGLGDLAGLDDADWTTDVSNRPIELTDGRITTALNASGVLLTNIPNASQIPNLTLSQITDSGTLAGLNSVGATEIDTGAVGTDELATGAVTEPKIGTGAVTTTKIGASAVTTAKLNDAAVTTAKLNDAAVATAKIEDNAVTNADQTTTTANQTSTVVQTIEFARHTQTLTSGSKAIVTYSLFPIELSSDISISILADAASPTIDVFLDFIRDPDGTPTTLESRQFANNVNNVTSTNVQVPFVFVYEDEAHGGGSTTYALEIRAVENGTSTLADMDIFWANCSRSIYLLEAKK